MEKRNTLKICLLQCGVSGTEAAAACGMTRVNFYHLYFTAEPTTGRGWSHVRDVLKRKYNIVYNRTNGWHVMTEEEQEYERQMLQAQINTMLRIGRR